MSKSDRRSFLKTLTATAGASAIGLQSARAGMPASSDPQVDRRKLGRTGAPVSILGLGLGGAFTQNVGGANHEETAANVSRLLNRALDLGVNYWDTARVYGKSEELIGPVVERRRKEIFLASKSRDRTYDGFMRDLERGLNLLKTDHLDIYFLHWLDPKADNDMDAIGKGAARAAMKAREEGIIKHFGVTGHDGATILMDAMKRWNPDAVLTIFPATRPDNGRYEDELLPLAIEMNIGIIAMKTVKQGIQADLKGSDLIRYALSLKGVSTAIVGYDTIEHLNMNAAMATNFSPLPREQMAAIHQRAASVLAGISAPWERPGYGDCEGKWT